MIDAVREACVCMWWRAPRNAWGEDQGSAQDTSCSIPMTYPSDTA